jgi:hypothetical protein
LVENLKALIINFNKGVGSDLIGIAIVIVLIRILFVILSLQDKEELVRSFKDVFVFLIAVSCASMFMDVMNDLPTYIESSFTLGGGAVEELFKRSLKEKAIKLWFFEITGETVLWMRGTILAAIKWIRSWFVLGAMCFFSLVVFSSTVLRMNFIGKFYVFFLIFTGLYPILFSLIDNFFLEGLRGCLEERSPKTALVYASFAQLSYLGVPFGALKASLLLMAPALASAKNLLKTKTGTSKLMSGFGHMGQALGNLGKRSSFLNSGKYGSSDFKEKAEGFDEYRREKKAHKKSMKAKRAVYKERGDDPKKAGIKEDLDFKNKWSEFEKSSGKRGSLKSAFEGAKTIGKLADATVNIPKNRLKEKNKWKGINSSTVNSRKALRERIKKNSNNNISQPTTKGSFKTSYSSDINSRSYRTKQTPPEKNNRNTQPQSGYSTFIKNHEDKSKVSPKKQRKIAFKEETQKRENKESKPNRRRGSHVSRRIET